MSSKHYISNFPEVFADSVKADSVVKIPNLWINLFWHCFVHPDMIKLSAIQNLYAKLFFPVYLTRLVFIWVHMVIGLGGWKVGRGMAHSLGAFGLLLVLLIQAHPSQQPSPSCTHATTHFRHRIIPLGLVWKITAKFWFYSRWINTKLLNI